MGPFLSGVSHPGCYRLRCRPVIPFDPSMTLVFNPRESSCLPTRCEKVDLHLSSVFILSVLPHKAIQIPNRGMPSPNQKAQGHSLSYFS